MIVLLSVDVIVLGANIQKLFMIASILTKKTVKSLEVWNICNIFAAKT